MTPTEIAILTASTALVSALISALLGWHLGFKKTKNEKLWEARYKTLTDCIESFRIVSAHFSEGGNAPSFYTGGERAYNKEMWSKHMAILRENVIKCDLLFGRAEFLKIKKAVEVIEMNLFDLMDTWEPDDNTSLYEKIARDATLGIKEFSDIFKKHCL